MIESDVVSVCTSCNIVRDCLLMIISPPREKSGVDEANTLARWLKASFDALERKYLRELTLLIYLDPAHPEEVHELWPR